MIRATWLDYRIALFLSDALHHNFLIFHSFFPDILSSLCLQLSSFQYFLAEACSFSGAAQQISWRAVHERTIHSSEGAWLCLQSHRTREWSRWKGLLGPSGSTLAPAGTPERGAQAHPQAAFWRSPRRRLDSLWAACASVPSPTQHRNGLVVRKNHLCSSLWRSPWALLYELGPWCSPLCF